MDLIAFSRLTGFHDAREGDYGFHAWTGHIHASRTGCITRALHPCGMLRRLQEVPGQLRAAHVQHTGGFHAGSRGPRKVSPGTRLRTYPRT